MSNLVEYRAEFLSVGPKPDKIQISNRLQVLIDFVAS